MKKWMSAWLAVCVIGAFAQEQETTELMDLSLEELLGLKVTSVSKTGELIGDAPAIVTVFTRSDLDRIRPRNLNELLGYTPGFLVAQEDDDYTLGNRGVVADNNQSYLVAVDGHRIGNNNNFGVNPFNFSRNLIDNAERIEIIRGPGGIFWGPDAFLGVINVITRQPQEQQEGDAGIELALVGGENETVGGYVASRRKVNEDLGFTLFLDVIHSEGEPIQYIPVSEGGRWSEDFEGVNLIGRYEDPSLSVMGRLEHKDFWMAGHVTHMKKFVPGWGWPSVEDFTQLFFEAGQNFTFSETQKLSAKLYADKFQAIRRTASSWDGTSLGFDFPELRIGGEALWDARWGKYLTSVFGWDARYYYYEGGVIGQTNPDLYEEGIGSWDVFGSPLPDTIFANDSTDTIVTADADNLSDGYVNPGFPNQLSTAQGEFYANGVFGQLTFKLPERLTVNAGLRLDFFSDHYDPILSPRASLTYYINENWYVKGLYAKAAMRPSWTQRYGFFSAGAANNNNDLIEPEKIQNAELAVFGRYKDKIRTTLTFLYQDIEDKINLVTPAESTVYKGIRIDTAYGFGFYNYADYNTIGLEWDTRVQLNHIFSAFFNPTYYFRVTRDENFEVGGTAGAGEVVADAEPQLGLTYDGNQPYSIPTFFFSAGVTADIPIRDLLNIGITPIVRYQGNTRYHSVKDAEGGGRIGYEWETDIFLMDLKAWIAGEIGSVPCDLSLNITNLFNNTEVVGFSSGAQAAMHLPGIHYEGKLTVAF